MTIIDSYFFFLFILMNVLYFNYNKNFYTYLLKWNLVYFVISKETEKISYIIIIVILYKWKFEIFMFLIII